MTQKEQYATNARSVNPNRIEIEIGKSGDETPGTPGKPPWSGRLTYILRFLLLIFEH